MAAGAAAAEREFATVLALGYIAPLGSDEAPGTPVLLIDHESAGYPADGTFRFKLETSSLRTGMRHALDPLVLGYHAVAQVVSEGDGVDLYDAGTRRRGLGFEGHSGGAGVSLGLFAEGPWRAEWQIEARRSHFEPADETAAGTVLPGDLTTVEHDLSGARHGLLGAEEASLALGATFGRRANARPWALDDDPARHDRYRRHALRWDQPVQWAGGDRSRLRLALLGGGDLDVLSGYRVGGFASREVVAGYYRNEFRATRVAVLNLEHEWRFAGDVRLTALLDAARLDELPLPFRTEPAQRRNLAGAGVGLYLPLGFLAGAPLILRYGEGLRVPDGAPEGHRREVVIVLAGGF